MKRIFRRGFTIVELLMVITIISILLSLITLAARNAFRAARERRSEAMRVMLENGIASYHAQEGKWPGAVESAAASGETRVLGTSEAQAVFREICKKSVGRNGNPYVDASSLFVAPTGSRDGHDPGMLLKDAVRRGERHRKFRLSELDFGYQETAGGQFHRFGLKYNSATDAVTVTK